MTDFKKQIQEDIDIYKEKYSKIINIDNNEWAFNFWILDNLFTIDENIIEEFIIDYNDKGIDCYVWHEDLLDLYLIQNKYYSESTLVSNSYIQNDFLTRAIGALEKGTYTRSKTLQDIYNKYSNEEDFSIHFHLYVTNNDSKNDKTLEGITKFNETNASKRYNAKIFSLDDIQELYYKESIKDKKSFKFSVQTINKGTILKVDNESYNLDLELDAKYVLTPVKVIFEMYEAAAKQRYPLFEENIREYLGSNGSVNKKIVSTLKNPNDRNNFFFYNNGITMIVSDMGSDYMLDNKRVFEVYNPQIVNGCQTVSTIHETLSSLPESTLDVEFKNAFVMMKILRIPSMKKHLLQYRMFLSIYKKNSNGEDF
jgi:hypothetical protein